MLCIPYVLGGSPTRGRNENGLHHPCLRGGGGAKEGGLATSRFPSRGPKRGQTCYATPTFLGVPPKGDTIRIGYSILAFLEAQKGAELLRNSAFSGDPQKERKSELATSPLPSRGPKRGRNGCVTLRSRGSRQKGTKSESATLPLPSRGPKRGQNCYAAAAFLGVPRKGDKIKIGYNSPTFSGGQKKGRIST